MLYRVSLTGKHDRFSVPQLGYLGYHRLTLSWIERLARESKHVIRVRVVHCSPGRAPALPVSSPNQTSVAYADTRGATTLFNWTEVGLKAVFSMRWLCCPRIRIGRHRNQSCGKEDGRRRSRNWFGRASNSPASLEAMAHSGSARYWLNSVIPPSHWVPLSLQIVTTFGTSQGPKQPLIVS